MHLLKQMRNYVSFIASAWAVNLWLGETSPTCSEARPRACPHCGSSHRGADGRLLIYGHGRRGRHMWGPPLDAPLLDRPGSAPGVRIVQQRRYKCQVCRKPSVVGPRLLIPGRFYTAPAIALALHLMGAQRPVQFGHGNLHSIAEVRRRVCIWQRSGDRRGWVTLGRWLADIVGGRLFTLGEKRWQHAAPLLGAGRRLAREISGWVMSFAPPQLRSAHPDIQVFRAAQLQVLQAPAA